MTHITTNSPTSDIATDDTARRAVELAIETSEPAALEWLKQKTISQEADNE